MVGEAGGTRTVYQQLGLQDDGTGGTLEFFNPLERSTYGLTLNYTLAYFCHQQFSICFDRLGINSQTGIKNVLKHVNTSIFNLF